MSPRKRPATWKRRLGLLLNIVLFGVALAVLRKILTEYHLVDIVRAIDRIDIEYLLASLALTILGYAALVGYDYLSLRVAAHPVPISRMWSASFISHAVQNSAPMSIVAGGGLRYRLFNRLGVSGAETAAVVASNLLTFVIGLFAVAGLSFAFAPIRVPAALHLPVHSLRIAGGVLLLLVAAALARAEFGSDKVRIGRRVFDLPHAAMLWSQLGVSIADWLLSSTALYVLLLAEGPVSFPHFLSAFLLAQIATQVVPLPGGVGVFEAAMLLLRPDEVSAPFMTAALLLYRVIYYLLPLFGATALLATRASQKRKREMTSAGRVAREITPHVLAVLTFIVGVLLLVTTTLPGPERGMAWFGKILELALIEGSHFIGSLVGMGLILLAFGLERRLSSAFHITVVLLLLAIPTALLRALDIGSAAILTALLFLLILARSEFNRRIPFGAEPINAGWVAASIVAVLGIGWLGIYMQVHHQYTGSLWWRFALDQDAPRTLRVAISVLASILIFVLARLVSRARRVQRIRRRSTARTGARAKSSTPGEPHRS